MPSAAGTLRFIVWAVSRVVVVAVSLFVAGVWLAVGPLGILIAVAVAAGGIASAAYRRVLVVVPIVALTALELIIVGGAERSTVPSNPTEDFIEPGPAFFQPLATSLARSLALLLLTLVVGGLGLLVSRPDGGPDGAVARCPDDALRRFLVEPVRRWVIEGNNVEDD